MTRFEQFEADARAAATSCSSPEQARRDGAAFPLRMAAELHTAGHKGTTVWLDAENVLVHLRDRAAPRSIEAEFFNAAYDALREQGSSSRPAARP